MKTEQGRVGVEGSEQEQLKEDSLELARGSSAHR